MIFWVSVTVFSTTLKVIVNKERYSPRSIYLPRKFDAVKLDLKFRFTQDINIVTVFFYVDRQFIISTITYVFRFVRSEAFPL